MIIKGLAFLGILLLTEAIIVLVHFFVVGDYDWVDRKDDVEDG